MDVGFPIFAVQCASTRRSIGRHLTLALNAQPHVCVVHIGTRIIEKSGVVGGMPWNLNPRGTSQAGRWWSCHCYTHPHRRNALPRSVLSLPCQSYVWVSSQSHSIGTASRCRRLSPVHDDDLIDGSGRRVLHCGKRCRRERKVVRL